jgi:hypothetical protein
MDRRNRVGRLLHLHDDEFMHRKVAPILRIRAFRRRSDSLSEGHTRVSSWDDSRLLWFAGAESAMNLFLSHVSPATICWGRGVHRP